MLRDKNLIPLSHQHQHALALCVRIERASPIPAGELPAWRAEIAQLFTAEIGTHFAVEEQVVFPPARKFPELEDLVCELTSEHTALRAMFAAAQCEQISSQDVATLGQRLSAHVRKEERQLFERMQQLMPEPELATLGGRLQDALKDSVEGCLLPSETTRLRPSK